VGTADIDVGEDSFLPVQRDQPEAESRALATDFLGVEAARPIFKVGGDLLDKAGLPRPGLAG